VTQPPKFDPDLLRFLAELKTHNNKRWFEQHKARYERVYKEPLSEFVAAVAPRLARISPYLIGDPKPSGGSVMRIYRDIRFSKDKSPYRSYTVVHFWYRGSQEGTAPGLFLYISPDEVSGGGGLWHPGPDVAHKIRTKILRDSDRWVAITRSAAFRKKFELTGESLKRPPPGFPKESRVLEDLMRKDFVASTTITQKEFTSADFARTYEAIARRLGPMLAFLCEAVGLPFR
jgi:uncharacterized protein (TIGR02453 family)